VEIGTASFANPRAPWLAQQGLKEWMQRHHVNSVTELIGVAHG
jgi:dihydroorotate dehydrogenase